MKSSRLSKEEERRLVYEMQNGSKEARNRLIESNMRLVTSAIRQCGYKFLEYGDRFSIGCEGLIKAVDTYDPTKGALSSHVYRCVRAAFTNELRKDRNPRNVISMDAPVKCAWDEETRTLHDVIPASNTDALENIIRKETLSEFYNILDKLPPSWGKVLSLRYINNMSQTDIAKKIRKSRSRIQQIEEQALKYCRKNNCVNFYGNTGS